MYIKSVRIFQSGFVIKQFGQMFHSLLSITNFLKKQRDFMKY